MKMKKNRIFLMCFLLTISLNLTGCTLFGKVEEQTTPPSETTATTVSAETEFTTLPPIFEETTISNETTSNTSQTQEEITTAPPIVTTVSSTTTVSTETIPPVSINIETETTQKKYIKCTFEGVVTKTEEDRVYVKPDKSYVESDWSDSFVIYYENASDLDINDVIEIVYYDNKIDKETEPIRIVPESVKYLRSIVIETTAETTAETEPVETETPTITLGIDKETIGAIPLDSSNAGLAYVYHDIYIKDIPSQIYKIDDYASLCNVFKNLAFQETVDKYYGGEFYIGPLSDYNEDFFTTKSLIMIKEIRNNSNTKVELEKVFVEDNKIIVQIKDTPATIASNKMGYNLFCIEIPHEYHKNKDLIIRYSDKDVAYN